MSGLEFFYAPPEYFEEAGDALLSSASEAEADASADEGGGQTPRDNKKLAISIRNEVLQMLDRNDSTASPTLDAVVEAQNLEQRAASPTAIAPTMIVPTPPPHPPPARHHKYSASRSGSVLSSRKRSATSSLGDLPSMQYEPFGSISVDYSISCGAGVIPLCCQYSPTGDQIAVGLTNGLVRIYTPIKCINLYALQDETALLPSQGVTAVRYVPTAANVLAAGYATGAVKIWHVTSGKALTTFEEDRETLNIAVEGNGHRLLSVGGSPNIYLYDLEARKRIETYAPSVDINIMDGHRQKVFAVRFHPTDPHSFYSAGWDNTVQFWDTRSSRAVRSLFGPHICGDGIDLDAFHGHLITGSWRSEDVIQIWDWKSLELIKTVELPKMCSPQSYCCAWLGEQYILVGGSSENCIGCIDRCTLNVTGMIRNLPGGVYASSCHPGSARGGSARFAFVSDSYLAGATIVA